MSAGVSDALVVAGVFASADPVAFVHPIVRSGIYRDIGDAERAALHGRAAEQLMTAGEPSDRVASHILRASPAGRDAFVGQLIDAGGRALQRGAPDATVACLRRALDEPPPAPARVAVLRMLGIAEMMLSDAGAATHLKEARNLATEPSDRTEISRALALVHTMSARLPEAVEVLDSAIDELSPTDSEAAMAIEAHLVNIARVHPEMWPIARRRTEGLAERLANRGSGERSHAERLALVQVAVEATSTIRPASEVRRIALDAWDEGRLLIEEGLESPPVVLAGLVLLFSDAFDEARALFDAALEDAVNRGSPSGAAHVLCFRAHVHLRTGSVAEAETDARVSIDAVETPQPLIFPMQLAALIEALVERSEIAEAQSVLERYGYDGPVPGVYHDLHLLCSRGRLRLAQGRTEDARNDLMLAGERHQGWGMPNPAILGWRAWAAHAHVAIGDRDTAMRLASEDVEMARSFGAPRALGIGLRALAGAVGRKDGIDLLREADAVLEGSQARLEHARVLADLGAALRRTNRRTEAREPLTRALDIAQRCGATGLVEHAETELRATGARPRRAAATGAAALTPSEARIAKMAANGMRNREIAQQLFVTVKTVEDHLSHAYAKLGIRSRDELTRVLSS
jgi:DNA-binding CsgD family transcriptional regulator